MSRTSFVAATSYRPSGSLPSATPANCSSASSAIASSHNLSKLFHKSNRHVGGENNDHGSPEGEVEPGEATSNREFFQECKREDNRQEGIPHNTNASAPPLHDIPVDDHNAQLVQFNKYKESTLAGLEEDGYKEIKIDIDRIDPNCPPKLKTWLQGCTYYQKNEKPFIILKIIDEGPQKKLFLIRAKNLINNLPIDIINIETNWSPDENYDFGLQAFFYPNNGKYSLDLSSNFINIPNLSTNNFMKNTKVFKFFHKDNEHYLYIFEIKEDTKNWILKDIYIFENYEENIQEIKQYLHEGINNNCKNSLIKCANRGIPITRDNQNPIAQFFQGTQGTIFHSREEKHENYPYYLFLTKQDLTQLGADDDYSNNYVYIYFYNPNTKEVIIKNRYNLLLIGKNMTSFNTGDSVDQFVVYPNNFEDESSRVCFVGKFEEGKFIGNDTECYELVLNTKNFQMERKRLIYKGSVQAHQFHGEGTNYKRNGAILTGRFDHGFFISGKKTQTVNESLIGFFTQTTITTEFSFTQFSPGLYETEHIQITGKYFDHNGGMPRGPIKIVFKKNNNKFINYNVPKKFRNLEDIAKLIYNSPKSVSVYDGGYSFRGPHTVYNADGSVFLEKATLNAVVLNKTIIFRFAQFVQNETPPT